MAATKEDVKRWIEHARKNKYEYIISVCDTFDHSDYPVYCNLAELSSKKDYYDGNNMQRINEIIIISEQQ